MKLLQIINCFLICGTFAIWVSAEPVPSDRIDFIELLNKDREKMGVKIGTPIKKLIYDANLEAEIPKTSTCRRDVGIMYLKRNDVTQEFDGNSKMTSEAENLESLYFFAPDALTIGCSTTFKCSEVEKKVEYFGACIFGQKVKIGEFETKLIKAGLPPVSKYAALLGVDGAVPVEPKGEEEEGSGAEHFFSLIIYFLMLVYL